MCCSQYQIAEQAVHFSLELEYPAEQDIAERNWTDMAIEYLPSSHHVLQYKNYGLKVLVIHIRRVYIERWERR